MEDPADESGLTNAILEKEIYDEILANLDGLDDNNAAEMYPIKEEFPSFERNYTYEEIKDPRLRSVINDHNYISSEDSYSRDVRQNLIDFVQLTNSNIASKYTSTTESQVETLIDSVLTFLSKVTDYDSSIDKIKAVFSSEEKKYSKTELQEESSKKDEALVDESIVDDVGEESVSDPAENDFPQELDPNIKLELSAFIKMEGDDAGEIDFPLIQGVSQSEQEQKDADDEMSELNKQIEMILGKDEEEDSNIVQNKLELEPEKKVSTDQANNTLIISKVEYTYDPNSDKKKDEQKPTEEVDDSTSNITKTSQPEKAEPDITNIAKEQESDEPMQTEGSDSSGPKELQEIPDGSCSDALIDIVKESEQIPELFEKEISKENDCSESITEQTKTIPVVKELLRFAEQLKVDCFNFSEENDSKIEEFLSLKLKEHRNTIQSVLFKDSSMQTENIISKKKLRKLNASDKRHLLESSNDSDSSNSSYMDKTLNELEAEYKKSKKKYFSGSQRSSKESLVSKKPIKDSKYFRSDSDDSHAEISPFNGSLASLSRHESDDLEQITDAEETRKDKTKTSTSLSQEECSLSSSCSSTDKSNSKTVNKSLEKNTNESDKENRDSVTSSESCESKKSKQDDSIEDDPQEKEIERLLNLKGLVEPQKNVPSINNSKQKTSNKLSSKTDSFFDVMQEIDRNSVSDDSIGEDSEQILTEKQFLVKCNENLKKQLLDSASSDSENSTNNGDIELINTINDNSSDEENQRVSYVDKFLENLVDDEGKSSIHEDDVSKKEESPSRMDTTKSSNDSMNKTESPADEAIENSVTTFRDAFDKKKTEKKEKCFESILAKDTRQRALKMQEDLIELSAESSNSDIEEISTETKEKNLRIKPMLRHDQLESETLNAQKKEADRLRRLEKRNNFLTKMLKNQSENIDEKDLVLDYASSTKKFIKVNSDIVKHLKPHQRDGVKFMYDSCYGCVDALKDGSGSGCILAHCMGLGKTLQVIALLHTVTSYKELKTSKILVLCPKSTIMNWADEIKRWLGPLEVKNLQIFNFSDTADIYDKINVLRKWASVSQKSGCLIMGYEAFRSLVFYNTSKTKARPNMRVEDIRDNIHKYLLKPGADLVVCDEGHIIKNRKSGISLAAAEIITPKRIILTGTPIQNNLKEYYAMVNFIKPLILGTEKEFANLYANPIKNGQHKDSSKRDIKVMKQRSFVLHKKLSKFVQRKEAELLQSFLPQKFEYVLFIPMTDVQNTLYEYVLDAISKREDSRGKSLIPDYTCLRKIWTHPKVLEDAWKNAMVTKNKKEFKRLTSNHIGHSDDDQPDDIYDSQTGVISVQRDWWRELVTESDLELILPSNKLKTMFEIIRMAEENGEKCLIFTAFVAVLNVVEYFFHKINDKQRDFFMYDAHKPTGHWINGQDYYRLDGKTNKTLRHEMVKRFNDPKNKRTRVFLISAKAGGQGINLIGANRVIILDTSWNPANDQQNIFRIFRLGQKKNCYVYRLIAMGTMEEKVYSRSVTKQAMSFRVVDEQQIDRHYNMAELAELYTLTKPDYKERPVPVFPQDQILANLLLNSPDLVYKYHEHDSLLENKMEQELSEQEKADAWVAYERDLQMNSEPRDAMEGFQGYPLFGQGNYMYPPIPDFDPKNFLAGNYDPSQMDMASRNPLASAMLPNYITNANMSRNSYLDILNMYKNLSSSLLGDKSGRTSHFNSPYGMPLGAGMMNNSAILPTNESHLSALANPFYPYSSSSLNPNALLSNPNLTSSNPMNADRYEQSKNLMTSDHNFSSSMRNSFPAQMPAPYTKDLTGRSTQSKNLLQSPSTGPPSSSPIMRSSTRQVPQNIYNTNPTRETIPTNIIPKKLVKSGTTKPSQGNIPPSADVPAKHKPADTLLRPISPRQTIVIDDSPAKQSNLPPLPVNMGIVYPKPIPLSLSPISELVEGSGCVKKPGSSMQIIRTDSPVADSVRKKFDNISPNISLTAVRTLNPKTSQCEKSPSLSTYIETTSPPMTSTTVTPSNVRKRRSSFGSSSSAININEQPKKVSKYN
ncbi:transcriptional regulator ATRX homolog [Eupeodes corollae]|uniref:transcriptional regulator ATRX homolog n=1 Tax=Eupeodes corollae TaxID=290404 RepID=UPI0024914BEE|nr:transcriptional regulator ATRX homolog [Eupeodes corollae]